MATDATGTPTPLGIPKFNTSADAPSGLGSNAQMDALDALIAARVVKPASIASGEVPVWNGSSWDRSSVTRIGISSIASGTPTGSKFVRDDGVLAVPAVGGSLVGIQVLTASGTYTPTGGTTKIFVEAIGAGGGSGGIGSSAGSLTLIGGGGGGGAYAAKLITSAFSGVSYAIGAGGTAGTAGNNAGGAGGDTTFNTSVVVAKGGAGGPGGATASGDFGGAGGDRATSTGDVKISGSMPTIRHGGVAPRGGLAALQTSTVATATAAAVAGLLYGGGAAGPYGNNTATTVAGAAGGAGLIIVWEFA